MIRKTEEIKTQLLRIMITIRLMIKMMIMMMRLINTDDKNHDSYKNDGK